LKPLAKKPAKGAMIAPNSTYAMLKKTAGLLVHDEIPNTENGSIYSLLIYIQ